MAHDSRDIIVSSKMLPNARARGPSRRPRPSPNLVGGRVAGTTGCACPRSVSKQVLAVPRAKYVWVAVLVVGAGASILRADGSDELLQLLMPMLSIIIPGEDAWLRAAKGFTNTPTARVKKSRGGVVGCGGPSSTL